MIENESSVEEAGVAKQRRFSLWLTLVVSTLMVALSAYVLSFALLGPDWGGRAHRSASAAFHLKS